MTQWSISAVSLGNVQEPIKHRQTGQDKGEEAEMVVVCAIQQKNGSGKAHEM